MKANPNVLILATMLAALIASCSDQVSDPTAPTSRSSPSPSAALVDVSGLWNWSNEERLTMPEIVAAMFGIPPEGPITQIRCESSGTMVLTQVGSSFSGPAERTSISCETKGGFAFLPGPQFAPVFFDVEDGRIRGNSIHFVFGGAPLPTPSHGVVSASVGGVATVLKGTGRTIVPGHPHSPVPVDPPPGGTSTMIAWEATRP